MLLFPRAANSEGNCREAILRGIKNNKTLKKEPTGNEKSVFSVNLKKNNIIIGIDTSCYTTSIAAISLDKSIILNEKNNINSCR